MSTPTMTPVLLTVTTPLFVFAQNAVAVFVLPVKSFFGLGEILTAINNAVAVFIGAALSPLGAAVGLHFFS